jgi:hypothetical protein
MLFILSMDKYCETYPSEGIINKLKQKIKRYSFAKGRGSWTWPQHVSIEHFNPIASKALFAYVCFRKKS